jgi:hypothetical protein
MQALGYGRSRIRSRIIKVHPGPEKRAGESPLTLPQFFLNLAHARNCLQTLLDYMFASLGILALGPNAQQLDESIRQYQCILREWHNKFAIFLDVSMTFSSGREDKISEFRKSAILLKMH